MQCCLRAGAGPLHAPAIACEPLVGSAMQVLAAVKGASKPVIYYGGGCQEARDELREFAYATGIPVTSTLMVSHRRVVWVVVGASALIGVFKHRAGCMLARSREGFLNLFEISAPDVAEPAVVNCARY
jgi:hypothetical protein